MARSTCAKRLMVLLLLCLFCIGGWAQQEQYYRKRKLKKGDLLFHLVEKQNAITEVTPGQIDHVAICLGRDSVIEAVGRGVVVTAVDSLLAQEGSYLVGRVSRLDRRRSLERARTYMGRAYDWVYLPDNADIYCSELVTLSYVDKHGDELFQPIPMSFHDQSGLITPYWQAFYARRQMPVPEGLPGSNPGELSLRPQVRLLGVLVKP